MRRLTAGLAAVAATGVLASACTETDRPDSALAPVGGTASIEFGVGPDPVANVLKVCKEGSSAVFVLTWADNREEFTLADGECAQVHSWLGGTSSVTITEVIDPANPLRSIWKASVDGSMEEILGTNTVSGFLAGVTLTFHNGDVMVQGRMTGGGHQLSVDGARVTRGLTLHCDIILSNNLEINWRGGNKWHLEKESLSSVTCIDDPAFQEEPPRAPFNTFIAEAVGRLNGVDGSIIRFKFIDDGEPGRTDEAHFRIWAPGDDPDTDTPVLEVGGQLDGGNLQAHFDQPHGSNG